MSASAAEPLHGHDDHGHDTVPVVVARGPPLRPRHARQDRHVDLPPLRRFFLLRACCLGYGLLRGGSPMWHHPGEPELGINFTAFLTFLLICSSVTHGVRAGRSAVEGNRKQHGDVSLALTILGGIGFLCGQMHEYFGFLPFLGGGEHGLIGEGLVFGHSDYANTFYVTTTFHGCHVFAGVIYLTVMLDQHAAGKYDGKPGAIELVGLFWHFVDLVWILVFTLIYLVP